MRVSEAPARPIRPNSGWSQHPSGGNGFLLPLNEYSGGQTLDPLLATGSGLRHVVGNRHSRVARPALISASRASLAPVTAPIKQTEAQLTKPSQRQSVEKRQQPALMQNLCVPEETKPL